MPVGDSLSRWATALYNNFPNRPKRMSALDSANAMKAMAEARKVADEAYAIRMGGGKGGGGGGGQQKPLSDTIADGPTGTSGGTGARRYGAGVGGGGGGYGAGAMPAPMANPGASAMALPTAPTEGTGDYGMASYDYSPMLPGGDQGFDYGFSGGEADTGGMASPVVPDATAMASALPATETQGATGDFDYAGGMGGLSSGFAENNNDQTQGTPTPMDNAAAPGLASVDPDVAVPQDIYASGVQRVPKTGLYQLEENEAVVPERENPAVNADKSFTPIGEIISALPDSKRANEMFVAPANAVGRGLSALGKQAYNDFVQPVVNQVAPAVDRFQKGLALDFPEKPPQAVPVQAPAPTKTTAPAPVSPGAVSANAPAVAGVKEAITKPQMDYATWAKQNPQMAGKGDVLLDPAKREAFLQSMKGAPAVNALPGTDQTKTPAPIMRADYTLSPADQKKAAQVMSGVQTTVGDVSGAGGGGMAVHDAQGNILSTNVLPTDAQRGRATDLMSDAQNMMIQDAMSAYRRNEIGPNELAYRLSTVQKMNEPTKAAQFAAAEKGKTDRAKMAIDAQNSRAEKALAQRADAQGKTISSKTIDTAHEAREELKKQYNKDYSEAMKMDDPEERNRIMIDLNKSFYSSMLPPEYKDLSLVPNTYEQYERLAKRKAYEMAKADPNNATAQKLWKDLNTADGLKELRNEHGRLVKKRSDILKSQK